VQSQRATEPDDRAQHPADFGSNARPPHRASKSSRPGEPRAFRLPHFRIDGRRTFKGLAPTTSKGRLAADPSSPRGPSSRPRTARRPPA